MNNSTSSPNYVTLPNAAAPASRCTRSLATIRPVPSLVATAFAVYYGFAIKALSYQDYKDEEQRCVYSGMWVYLLLSLLSNGSLLYIRRMTSPATENADIHKLICGNAVMTFYRIGFFAWGTSELFSAGCKRVMHGTLLYNVCAVQYVMDISMLGGLLFHSGYIIPILLNNSKIRDDARNTIRRNENSGSGWEDLGFTRTLEI